MSQEKIDAYKKEKAGRKERIAKHKVRMRIAKICGGVVLVAAICAIAGSIIYNNVSAEKAEETAVTEEAADTVESVDGAETTAEGADTTGETTTETTATEVTATDTEATETTEVTATDAEATEAASAN